MTIDEKIKVMQAYRDGEKIEMKIKKFLSNWTHTENPVFNFDDFDYRIAPKKPREFWIAFSAYDDDPWVFNHRPVHAGKVVHVREVID